MISKCDKKINNIKRKADSINRDNIRRLSL